MPAQASGTTARKTRTRATGSSKTSSGKGAKTGAVRRSYTPPKTDLAALRATQGAEIVYLAEKHSIARALADALPGRGVNKGGYIECGNALVTWLSGHLLEQAPPEAYDPAYKSWSRATLPIVPKDFVLLVRKDRGSAEQLEVIKTLLELCPRAVNAADFDREGQLLVDEVLELVRYSGQVLRLQTKALDKTSLVRELGRMRNNADFAGLAAAARARSQLDWLAGMNLTRAMTIHGRSLGASSVLSLGRVQTPTLALVVERDEAIEHFVPKPFYKLTCPFAARAGVLETALVVQPDMAGVDSEKRLVDRAEAERIRDLVSGKQGEVVLVENKRVQEQAPLPYTLTDLQKEASARFGLGAQATLAAAQRLYEARFISYPRSDCPYLPDEQFAEADQVLAAVGQFEGMADMVAACDLRRRSAAWNTAKVEAHHGIIPTTEAAHGLSDHEIKVYTLICRRYSWQFLPPHIFHKMRVDVLCEGFVWRANGRREESAGWTAFKLAGPALTARERDTKAVRGRGKKAAAGEGSQGDVADGEEAAARDVILPAVQQGEAVQAGEVVVNEAMTTPPQRFTEGTLVDAMENIQRYVKGASADAQSILKKTEGLGTVATRASILETLFARNYLARQGKALVSTQLGRDVIHNCPACIKDPLMTADMEQALSEIQRGTRNAREYVASYAASLPATINEIFAVQGQFASAGTVHVCPSCGKALRRVRSKKGSFFWSCSGYPQCSFACNDANGVPATGAAGGGTAAGPAPGSGQPFEPGQTGAGPGQIGSGQGRSGQSRSVQAGSGLPAARQSGSRHAERGAERRSERGGASMDTQQTQGGGAAPLCPSCGREMVRRTSARGPFWGCSGYPNCRHIIPIEEGAGSAGQAAGSADPGSAAPGAGQGAGAVGAHGAPLCPSCGREMVRRTSARGPFWGCSGYPHCRRILQIEDEAGAAGQPGGQAAPHAAPGAGSGAPAVGPNGAPLCPGCGREMVRRTSARGPFWGCSGYPHCRRIIPIEEGPQTAGQAGGSAGGQGTAHAAPGAGQGQDAQGAAVCPRCGRPLAQRHGRNGPFWGCTGYPSCRYTTDSLPGEQPGEPGGQPFMRPQDSPGQHARWHEGSASRAPLTPQLAPEPLPDEGPMFEDIPWESIVDDEPADVPETPFLDWDDEPGDRR